MVVSGTAELEEFGDQRQEAEGMSWEWVARVCVCACVPDCRMKSFVRLQHQNSEEVRRSCRWPA